MIYFFDYFPFIVILVSVIMWFKQMDTRSKIATLADKDDRVKHWQDRYWQMVDEKDKVITELQERYHKLLEQKSK